MPSYDYKCHRCNTIVEKFHSIKEDPYYACTCGNHLVRILVSATPVHFKGSGFYETDYKGK